MPRVTPLTKFADSRGWSLNNIYEQVPLAFRQQVNFSILYPGIVKAWHRHKHQDDYFDEKGPEKFFIGEHNPAIIHIKAGEWHGLTAIGDKPVGLLYLVTEKYNPNEPDEERAGHLSFVDDEWWKPENK